MKRKILSLLLVFYFLFSFPMLAAALDPLARFVDGADLVTDFEESDALERRMTKLLYTYDMDVVIVTTNSLDGKSATAYADDYYDTMGYGIDGKHSGLLFLIAMDERSLAISTCGNAIRAVTDQEIDRIYSYISDDLSSGNYYEAFDGFLDSVEAEYLAYTENSTTEDNSFDAEDILIRFVIALVIGAIIAGIALLIIRSCMNTAKQQAGAASYMIDTSYDLYRCQDIFLYSKTTKTPKAQNNSSSTHRSSSGRSHAGRSGRF